MVHLINILLIKISQFMKNYFLKLQEAIMALLILIPMQKLLKDLKKYIEDLNLPEIKILLMKMMMKKMKKIKSFKIFIINLKI